VKSTQQAGFTLVELIVVIVILGILAAVALPRFMGLEREARIAAVKSMGGTLQSAAQMAHGVCMAQNCNNNVIAIEGQNITFVNGYPNNAGISLLVQSTEGFAVAASTFTKTGATTNQCWVRYAQATIAAGVVTPPTLVYPPNLTMNAANEVQINTNLRTNC
jgi:MSHA pilin protein MshA